ncbi:hypothetical protein P9K31_03230 [Corynebacterium glutamicum]|nr:MULTISPECIES: hypothetical protein [Corynebacterium]NII98936.1 hypothetical protein [Corynebacterium glutamicum]WBG76219.1 hypothetical protein O5J82_12045 [Corynebacterium glutamicum]WFP73268.1 hypothetical protein P9K31_03230 [Corynebacterium glutamicum]
MSRAVLAIISRKGGVIRHERVHEHHLVDVRVGTADTALGYTPGTVAR